jgi:hypothetical protein
MGYIGHLNKAGKKKKAAIEFVRFMTRMDIQKQLAIETGKLPALKELFGDNDVQESLKFIQKQSLKNLFTGDSADETLVTNGVSRLQTNKYHSTCWPYCYGHALPPSWWKTCHPARNGGAHDHHGFYHGVVL